MGHNRATQLSHRRIWEKCFVSSREIRRSGTFAKAVLSQGVRVMRQ